MKKVFIISLSFVIVLLSFAFCFAAGASPVILPTGDNENPGGYSVYFPDSDRTQYYHSNKSPVYLVFYDTGSEIRALTFSDQSDTKVYFNIGTNPSIYTWTLSSQYDGYYYSSQLSVPPDSSYVMDGVFSSPQDVIDEVRNSVFNTSFNVTYLVDGSVSWLSSMAQAVKDNGLLLFFVLFIFVGVGIGLFKRFTN